MFPKAYFANRFFAGTYYAPPDGAPPPPPPSGPVRDFPILLLPFGRMGQR